MSVKTRFAPSPTGYLHIGGARTALFSWLYAQKHKGTFILRIEDTDLERSTEASVKAIFDGMSWLGLDHNEGPYYQTKRFDRYKEVIQEFLQNGQAYRCTCTRERLDALREQQMADKQKPRYDGCCRDKNIAADCAEDFVIRFRNPLDGDVLIADEVKGDVVVSNTELDDLIVARTDGTPTYNLTVVVDDIDMGLTHVIRGDDHLNNTPRQINMYQALGALLPKFAHVPMILGEDGKRLSKRHGAVGVMQYYEDGFLPEALLNYLVRLGWSQGDQEIFSVDEMIEAFSLEGLNKSPSTFNTEKLLWLNQHYIKEMPAEQLAERLRPYVDKLGVNLDSGPALAAWAEGFRDRAKTLVEMAELTRPYYEDFEEYDAGAVKKHFKAAALAPLQELLAAFTELDGWKPEALQAIVEGTAAKLELGMGKVGMPLRVAVCGMGMSPSFDVTLSLLGRDRVIVRLKRAISFLEKKIAQSA